MKEILWWLLLIASLGGVVYAWRHRLKKLLSLLLLIIVFLTAGRYVWDHRFGVPEDYADIEAQFKYGSLGSDHPMTRGIPYWIWRVLPDILPPSDIKPEKFRPKNGKKGYDAFGFLREDKTFSLKNGTWVESTTREEISGGSKIDRPIGFSKRRVFGMDFIGANCAFCHVSTLRKSKEDQHPKIILGMPGNGEDPEQFFIYLFAAVADPGFTADKVMNAILDPKQNPEQKPDMNLVERLLYRIAVIPLFRYEALKLKENFSFVYNLPRFGPGRAETWSAYKRTFIVPPQDADIPGIADFPSIWNQKARAGMRLHWDGNTPLLEERNIIAALGLVGPNIKYLDKKRLDRITGWITGLPAPRYEDWMSGYDKAAIHWKLVDRGRSLYRNYCAACHAPDGERIGRVEPLDAYQHQTDDNRLKSFTPELAKALNQLGTDGWQLRHFTLQKGYVNSLLDGIWLRAPYLHNGSVPTLRDLLRKDRPIKFCRGNDVYDWEYLGFVSAMVGENGEEPCGEFFLYDTKDPGNSNAGHLYGTDLPNADKKALLEFLKTL